MNKRIKKKKLKQEKMKLIKLFKQDPDCLHRVIEDMVKFFYENIKKLLNEVLEMAQRMKTEFFVGEEVIADGVETEITAIAHDDCGNKVYMVKGSMKDFYFDELRRINNVNCESR